MHLHAPLAGRKFFVYSFLAALIFCAPCLGDSTGFVVTGSLTEARAGHTATLLPDGRVLVVGGLGVASMVTTAELYDPTAGTWTAIEGIPAPPSYHTATLLPDGKVLVAGGYYGFVSAPQAYLFDPATNEFTATGDLIHARDRHTATLLNDGRVLVAAGWFHYLGYNPFAQDTAEVYDPASGTWTGTGRLADHREGHTAALLPDGRVLVAGGQNAGFADVHNLATAEIYDAATGVWMLTGDMTVARIGHTATLLPNGQVLVAAGYNADFLDAAELYDPATGTWAATGSLTTARLGSTATLLPNGGVLVAAGYSQSGNLASAELYDPVSETWSAAGTMETARQIPSATLLPDGEVLFAGGSLGNSVSIASAELYLGPPPALLNISTRLDVQTGDNVLISGFIITGSQPATVVLRGIGPSLALPGGLSDPIIEVHDASGAILAVNDNWKDDPEKQKVMDAGLAPGDEMESALWQVLDPGAYTVILRGQDGGTGMGLTEAYKLDQTSLTSTVANISTRALVQTNDNVLIGGFIIGGGVGQSGADVLVRALGPSLPVAGALSDPTLELHDGSGTLIDSNDNWKLRADGSSQEAEIEATTIPPGDDLEAALFKTLPPGSYTAIVRGKDDTTGVGLVEVYNLP